MKRRPARGGADLLGGDRHCLNIIHPASPQREGALETLRALHLIADFNVRPTLALQLAALAFGGRDQ